MVLSMGGCRVVRQAKVGVAVVVLLVFLGDSGSCWPLQDEGGALPIWKGNAGTEEGRSTVVLGIDRSRVFYAYRRQLQQVGIPPSAKGGFDKSNTSTRRSSGASPSPAPTLSLPHKPLSPSHSPRLSPGAPAKSPTISPAPVFSPSESHHGISFPPSPAPAEVHAPPSVEPEPDRIPAPSPLLVPKRNAGGFHQMSRALLLSAGVIGGTFVVLFSAASFVLCRHSKVIMVKPWATGLSGQLQKAFVTGVPKLNRSELEAACEDFSNIIGTSSDGTVYKGTLSSGVEIAVISAAVVSSDDWSKNREAQFRKKIETLSKINHKNFVNLIGFCEEDSPFTRMMVFEYAPNGTLFEHLHVKESEHLDWGMRLRIIMGISYCLDYMHQLKPPMVHRNLNSSTVYLTEDYAANLSDFSFWNDLTDAEPGSASAELLENPSVDLESNVYSFGVMLVEIITGRIPYSTEDGVLADWVYQYMIKTKTPEEVADPTLKSFKEDRIQKLLQVTRDCLQADPHKRPRMTELTTRLKDITTSMEPEKVSPKTSPLWWAELEIMSTASSEEVKPPELGA
ncbi:hypothetical protein MLD38_017413 [Melastoma candidum]|uniref:Uncharacterized protein n=1 Tax=Melastoma candidum TaxID=119954 RepID=A0ACB9QQJ7_9MYRT|nr:hypothetical protein MLD38_017413 [Melastoma candidum]